LTFQPESSTPCRRGNLARAVLNLARLDGRRELWCACRCCHCCATVDFTSGHVRDHVLRYVTSSCVAYVAFVAFSAIQQARKHVHFSFYHVHIGSTGLNERTCMNGRIYETRENVEPQIYCQTFSYFRTSFLFPSVNDMSMATRSSFNSFTSFCDLTEV